MKRSKKILIITLSSIVLLIATFVLAKTIKLPMTAILSLFTIMGLVVSSVMIIKAHKNEAVLQKRFFSNIAGGMMDLFITSLVMLVVWLIFSKSNAFYHAILITYPLVKFIVAFIDNKFYKFLDHFVFYRRYEEEKKKELEEESKKKALARKRLKNKK